MVGGGSQEDRKWLRGFLLFIAGPERDWNGGGPGMDTALIEQQNCTRCGDTFSVSVNGLVSSFFKPIFPKSNYCCKGKVRQRLPPAWGIGRHSPKRARPALTVVGTEVSGQSCHREQLIPRCPRVPWKVTA